MQWEHQRSWYKVITNILSLNAVKAKYRVTYDSENGRAFWINVDNGVIEFKEHPNSLHYATMDKIKGVVKNEKIRCFTIIDFQYDSDFLMMIDKALRKHGYTKQEIES